MNINLGKLLLLIFTIITWGYSWVLMKQALEYMGPFTFVALRNSIGAIFLIPLLIRKNSFNLSGIKNSNYFLVGILQTTAMFALIIYGMKFVTAGKTSVVLYTMPIWTTFLIYFYFKEKLSTSKWLGVLSGFIGILFILGWDVISKQNKIIIFGEILILLAAISWSIANLIIKKRLYFHSPSIVNGYQLLIGAIFLVVLAVITEGFFLVNWTYSSIYIILFTGIIASAVNFSIWFYLINELDINTTTYSSLLVPVFGLLFDYLILGTNLDIGLIAGGIFILFGIYKISK